jgi:hypothetical protein
MHYALVAPNRNACDANPGCELITAGIRWLLRQVDPAALFSRVDMLTPHPASWTLARAQADALLVCGNPRFSAEGGATWIEVGLWDALRCGLPVWDLWAGAAHGLPLLPLDRMAQRVLANATARRILERERESHTLIVRDKLAARVCELAGLPHALLPCCTWWSPREYAIEPAAKTQHAITVRNMPGHGWLAGRFLDLQRSLAAERPTYLVCHSVHDWHWLRASAPRVPQDVLCLSDPASLLRFYAATDKLISLRTHATLPAAALGAQVCDLSLDSRSLTCAEFGLTSTPFDALKARTWSPTFQSPVPPPLEPTLQLLRVSVASLSTLSTASATVPTSRT